MCINKCPSNNWNVYKAIVGDFLHLQGLILLLRCTNIDAFLTGISKTVKAKATSKYRRLSHAAFSHISINCKLQHASHHVSFNLGECLKAFFIWAYPFLPSNLEMQM